MGGAGAGWTPTSVEGGGNHTLVGSLLGTTLRVAFIRYSNELQPTDPACCPADGYSCVGCQWSGNTHALYERIQLRTGFLAQEVLISREAQLASNHSNWTACAHDVGLGNVDLCIEPDLCDGEEIDGDGDTSHAHDSDHIPFPRLLSGRHLL